MEICSGPLIRDLSKYDPDVLPYQDYDALVIRCYDGTDEDPKFQHHRANVLRLGKPWIPYSFYDFRFPAAPQIPEALMILGSEDGNQVLFLDVEEWNIYKFPPHDVLLANMKILYDTYVNMTGLKPGWYFSSVSVIHEHLIPVPAWLLECPLWIANWETCYPDYHPWTNWVLHQYQGEPDLNQYNSQLMPFDQWLMGEIPEPQPYPDYVIVNSDVNSLYLRTDPLGNISGYTSRGKKLKVIGQRTDANGKIWYDLKISVASWWTHPE